MTTEDAPPVTDVLQQVFIAVDEAGTEAAAATAVVVGLRAPSAAAGAAGRRPAVRLRHPRRRARHSALPRQGRRPAVMTATHGQRDQPRRPAVRRRRGGGRQPRALAALGRGGAQPRGVRRPRPDPRRDRGGCRRAGKPVDGGEWVELSSANRLFGQQGLTWQPDLEELLTLVDYADSEAARAAINAWTSEQTHERIPEIVPAGCSTRRRCWSWSTRSTSRRPGRTRSRRRRRPTPTSTSSTAPWCRCPRCSATSARRPAPAWDGALRGCPTSAAGWR